MAFPQQLPGVQVDSVRSHVRHRPEAHSTVPPLALPQLTQVAPPTPQNDSEGVMQLSLLQQPVGHVLGVHRLHSEPTNTSPEGHTRPASTGATQAPASQAPVHARHAAPSRPHCKRPPLRMQVPRPSQHPEGHVSLEHVHVSQPVTATASASTRYQAFMGAPHTRLAGAASERREPGARSTIGTRPALRGHVGGARSWR